LAKKSKTERKVKSGVRRLPPTSPAARDEGPRLVPLPEPGGEPSRLEHYLALADSALGVVHETDDKQQEEDGSK
jgi:hypothetical protein